jgi:hypothetical protein
MLINGSIPPIDVMWQLGSLVLIKVALCCSRYGTSEGKFFRIIYRVMMRSCMPSLKLTTISSLINFEGGLIRLQKMYSGMKLIVYLHQRRYCYLAWRIRWSSILYWRLNFILAFVSHLVLMLDLYQEVTFCSLLSWGLLLDRVAPWLLFSVS